MHELVVIHSEEELDCVRKAGVLCQRAMEAMIARAKPGVTEYELRAAAGAAIMDGGGDIDFLIIGSTPMANPAMMFGNPRPSHRKLKKGDIINMELAAGYRGMSAQIGSPITLGRADRDGAPVLGGHHAARLQQDRRRDQARQRHRQHAARQPILPRQGRAVAPDAVHGIDIVTDKPHVFAERTEADEIDKILKPGMIIMAEPNPITADGLFGIFLGHTFIVTGTATNGRQVPAGDRRRAVLTRFLRSVILRCAREVRVPEGWRRRHAGRPMPSTRPACGGGASG